MNKIFQPETNTVFVDMDGVIADFDKLVFDNMGRTFNHMTGPIGDKDMWDFLMTVENLYFKLEPTPYAFDLWKLVNSYAKNVEILTAIPRRESMTTAEQDKRNWVIKHFGPDVKFRIGPYSRDKWTHAIPGDILIDDRHDNIRDWINRGEGIGILHVLDDYENTVNRFIAMATEYKRF